MGCTVNRVRLIIAASLSLFVGCRDTQLPSVPGPAQAGTIGGTVLYAVPGKSELAAGAGARVSVLGSGASTTADAEGRFLIEGISRDNGILLLELEINAVSRRRVLRLEDIGAGTGRDISLGQVVLARNASVRGRIVLDDVVGASGLGGVTAFVPGGPWSAMTGDDGSYTIEALPEGALQVAFFKAGYSVGSLDVELGAGEER